MLNYFQKNKGRSAGSSARTGVAALGVLLAVPAHAALSDTFTPFVGVGYSYDDNLLRLSDAVARTGVPMSDHSRQMVAGVGFERPVGRQTFEGLAKVTKVSFDRFSQLDYNAKEASATWNWQLGNHVQGRLGGDFSETLVPFNDFHSAERNLRVQRGEFVEAKWSFHPEWQVRGGFKHNEFEYDLLSQRYLNRDVDGTELGLDYLTHRGSTIGLQLNHTRARYNDRTVRALEDYTQDSVRLKVYWKVGDVTDVQLLVGRAKRHHDLASGNDSSGFNGNLLAHWSPLSTLTLVGALAKEFEPFEGDFVSYSLNKRATLSAIWSPAVKVRIEARYQTTRRELQGPIRVVLPQNAEDSTRVGSINVNYQIRTNISLGASINRDVRSSNTAFSPDYRSKGASINANVQF
ncbi:MULTISPECIES: XrtB/PEP-CTERM-associated polysaccharide biosynthesis outer membrane protein EpsL [unclassified Duganella]|uniref:XrtB/PEP-CTERM-associated polysaccharide biosynthesis outer membrane protein EpsL n=1 Tax=unclassified Duganella TaxID=2636909 RepID=UPI0008885EB8|nr:MULTISPECIES: XrtB/PEP-CTERM-associated polysaccharide biosynthesis outer membrane protein EpsL [unclassified Duganella]SDH35677.1 exopolysaccharide biosynthesis operon protein EpsL [Duganella sp. OV458]SDK52134.1 exopolysaccharide biosynthesis operon protein EpsL [Duganella sp. OV510]